VLNPQTSSIEVLCLLPECILQYQKVSPQPAIMYEHTSKLAKFSSFVMQRSLRLYLKDKDRKAYLIAWRERKYKLMAEYETSLKTNKLVRDQNGCSLFKHLFGESFLNVRSGLYFDFLHCFSKKPSPDVVWIFDGGLAEMLDPSFVRSLLSQEKVKEKKEEVWLQSMTDEQAVRHVLGKL